MLAGRRARSPRLPRLGFTCTEFRHWPSPNYASYDPVVDASGQPVDPAAWLAGYPDANRFNSGDDDDDDDDDGENSD
jgi:hypothetical protein